MCFWEVIYEISKVVLEIGLKKVVNFIKKKRIKILKRIS